MTLRYDVFINISDRLPLSLTDFFLNFIFAKCKINPLFSLFSMCALYSASSSSLGISSLIESFYKLKKA